MYDVADGALGLIEGRADLGGKKRHLSPEEIRQLLTDLGDIRQRARWPALSRQIHGLDDPGMKPYLKPLFFHEYEDVRYWSAWKFLMMSGDSDGLTIWELVKNPNEMVRQDAFKALMKCRAPECDDALIDVMMNDSYMNRRCVSARELGRRRVVKSVPYLENALRDKDINVRDDAYVSLFLLTGKKYDYVGKRPEMDQRIKMTLGWEQHIKKKEMDSKLH
jgi:hypothetical protein